MRILFTLLTAAGFASIAASAGAQQNNNSWNNPSQQQQGDIKDFSSSVKDGLDNIGSAEQNISGQNNSPSPSTSDQQQVQDKAQDLAHQGSNALDSISQFR